ncbi:Host specificity protein J [Escherichia coli]|nr:Host specificity protein J [Escherichia coli]
MQHLTVEVSAADGQYLAQAKWDTPRVVKGVRFSLRLTSGKGTDARLVTTAITADTEHRFSGLPLGEYTLTVRAINSYGQQGESATTTFRINAPAKPATIELTPGYFQITAVPVLAVYDPTVQFEFWFSEKRITNTAQVEKSARYLGTGSQWTVQGDRIKPGMDFWFYVRSVNLVGKSAFVEASGQASNDAKGYLEFFRGLIDETLLGQALKKRIDASALRSDVTQLEENIGQLEEDIRQRMDTDIAEVTRKIGEAENSLTQLVAKKNEDQTLAIAQVSQKVDRVSSEISQTVSQSSEENTRQIAQVRQYVDKKQSEIKQTVSQGQSENARQIAQVRQYVDEKGSEIASTTDKKLGDQAVTIQQIQRVQSDTRDNLNAMYMLKVQKTKKGIPYVAGIGAGIEDVDGQTLSNILLQADRIAMITPENGNTTPLFVAQGNQLFMNDVFLKRLFAVSITSSGNPPTFSLTPDGRLTARNADISGAITANTGTLNNVTINENCVIRGKLSANQIEGDLVKTVGKAFPRDSRAPERWPSGTITVRVYDDQPFNRQIVIPAVAFSGARHERENSDTYSSCRLIVKKNGAEIYNRTAMDNTLVYSGVIDMPAGRGHMTLEFSVSAWWVNGWYPTASISDLLVVVMKKATAGITIS